MSSPYDNSDRSPSSSRSTPSHNQTNGVRRVNGQHRAALSISGIDAASQQLLQEFGRMLINDDRAFKRSLDEQTAVQQRLHLDALDRALARHEEVRESAERTRERVELEIERERRRREEEERKVLERARRLLEEQRLEEERRKLDETRAREEETRKREQLKKDQEAERARQETVKREQEETRRREEVQRKEEEARGEEKAASARQAPLVNGVQTSSTGATPLTHSSAPPAVTGLPNGIASAKIGLSSLQSASSTSAEPRDLTAPLPKGLVTDREEREAVHKQYLGLHQRLKQMREQVSEECKKVPGLKNQLSDWRRSIVKCCGQLGKGNSEEVKAANRRATTEIVQQLDAAANVAEPSIDVTQYLVQNHQPPDANTQGPAVLVFLLNYFAKGVIRQFISESAVDAKSADSIGVLAVTVFARPQYLFNGQSLIDLLWAKYHVHCPVLFGISGSERTKDGRARLGWTLDPSTGSFAPDQQHYDRMSGLGVGFAAITLRDFSKSKNANPAPNRIYWQALARILNTPANQIQPTHFVVLKAMIDQYVPRVIATFGGAGLAVLRQALIAFPNEKGPQDGKGRKVPAVTAVQAMPMILQRDYHLTL